LFPSTRATSGRDPPGQSLLTSPQYHGPNSSRCDYLADRGKLLQSFCDRLKEVTAQVAASDFLHYVCVALSQAMADKDVIVVDFVGKNGEKVGAPLRKSWARVAHARSSSAHVSRTHPMSISDVTRSLKISSFLSTPPSASLVYSFSHLKPFCRSPPGLRLAPVDPGSHQVSDLSLPCCSHVKCSGWWP
jgi:hypothetical protein